MLQCPECKEYIVEFDSHFRRPRCYGCGWLPSEFKVPLIHEIGIFNLCNRCLGYPELRKNGQCDKCKNMGKILGPLGKEVAEVIAWMKPGNHDVDDLYDEKGDE